MSKLIDKVDLYLKKIKFEPEGLIKDENLILVPGLIGKNAGGYKFLIIGLDSKENAPSMLLVESTSPIIIPLAKREKILNFLNELNKKAGYSCLSINMDNGEIMCRTFNISRKDDSWNENFIEPILFSPLNRIDALLPFIMELVHSEKNVKEILQKCNI